MTKFEELEQVIHSLRAPDGCPWDRVQTHETLKKTCIEEACEVICGINMLKETGNPENLKEELGDLLLQVIFQTQLAEEEGHFTMEEMIQGVIDKMVRRHPHVFAEHKPHYATVEEERAAWEEMKKKEKEGKVPEGDYLKEAFDESIELIHVAKRRKHFE
ncbi:MAG: nucleotide pyrophosphohydrolase [Lachnospiraceae bacterium]|nr:nucleotide pyrophosphohydrolase [Lachnospiraceae bacterium]